MGVFRRIAGGVSALFSRSRRDRELDAELEAFLDASIEDKMRRGLTRAAATRAARLELGSAAAVRDRVRDAGWEAALETIWLDVRHSARMLRRSPIFTIATVLLLTVGIGVNTAIFTLLDVVVLRPLPVTAPHRLVEPLSRYPGDPRMNGFSWESYHDLRDHNTVFADVVGDIPARFQVGRDRGTAEPVDGEYVVGTLFRTLGVRPALGRLIEPGDAHPGATPVIVLSWSYWKRQFDLDPAVLGMQLSVDGVPATIVGVTPRAFTGLQAGIMPAVWRPITKPFGPGLRLLARLKEGVGIEQAQAELRVFNRRWMEQIAARSIDKQWLKTEMDLVPAAGGYAALRERFATPLLVLMTAVGILLLLACTNVASMLLARATARRHEMAVRVSLGAGRFRLARQVLIECAMLSAAGAVLGIALAYAAAGALVRIMMSGRLPPRWPAQLDLSLAPDARIVLFTVGIAVLTAFLFGLAPAWSAFTAPSLPSLREAGRPGGTAARRRFGQGLVVAQMALSVVLLTGAFGVASYLSRLRNQDLGFDRHGVLLVSMNPQGSGLDRTQLANGYRLLLDRLHAVPGVRSATLSAVTPIQGAAASRFVSVDGQAEDPAQRARVSLNWVAPRYFETFRTPLVAGRDFRFEDAGGPDVAIVNQSLARHYFGGASPIGRRITLERETAPFEIVGVVADAKYADLHEPAPRTVYLNAFQGRIASHFALRTTLPSSSIAGSVRQVAAEVIPSVAIAKVITLDDQVNASIVIERLMATLSTLFAAAGAALAAIGLYGLLAYTVARRTAEIGVRVALGATDRDVSRLVLGGALGLACTGFAVGLPLAWWSARIAARLLPNLPSVSLWSTALAAAALLTVALLAAIVPARRASRIQPADALRHV
jgi:putative ABC transport system permease protein